MPKIEVHARGENCEDDELKILKHAVVCVMEEQRCEDVHQREKQTAGIVKYVMLQQDGVQAIVGCPPALYGAYEREADESQLERKQENKWYIELVAARSLVAACDAWYVAGHKWCVGSSGKENTDRCYYNSKKSEEHGC